MGCGASKPAGDAVKDPETKDTPADGVAVAKAESEPAADAAPAAADDAAAADAGGDADVVADVEGKAVLIPEDEGRTYKVHCPHCKTDKQKIAARFMGKTTYCAQKGCEKAFKWVLCPNKKVKCRKVMTWKDLAAYSEGDWCKCGDCGQEFNCLVCPNDACAKVAFRKDDKAVGPFCAASVKCSDCETVFSVQCGVCVPNTKCRWKCVHCGEVSEYERSKRSLQLQSIECTNDACRRIQSFVMCPYRDCDADTVFEDPNAIVAGARIVCHECERSFNKVLCPYDECGGVGEGLNVYFDEHACDQVSGPITCAACKQGYQIQEGEVCRADQCLIRCCHCKQVCLYPKKKLVMEGSALVCTHDGCGKGFKVVVCPNTAKCGKDIYFDNIDHYMHGKCVECLHCKVRFNKFVCPWHGCHQANVWLNDQAEVGGIGQDGKPVACVACRRRFKVHLEDKRIVRVKDDEEKDKGEKKDVAKKKI